MQPFIVLPKFLGLCQPSALFVACFVHFSLCFPVVVMNQVQKSIKEHTITKKISCVKGRIFIFDIYAVSTSLYLISVERINVHDFGDPSTSAKETFVQETAGVCSDILHFRGTRFSATGSFMAVPRCRFPPRPVLGKLIKILQGEIPHSG